MTPKPITSLELPTNKDAHTNSLERRTTSSTFSGSTKGYSIGSSEAGESSTAISQRNSFVLNDEDNAGLQGEVTAEKSDAKGSRRSHRSRGSGGFLLSNSTFEPPADRYLPPDRTPENRRSPREQKGKAAIRAPERKSSNRKSNTGLGIGGSPLAANVASAPDNGVGGDSTTDIGGSTTTTDMKAPLDVDSAQIVNLALNLSESRRNAARRNLSSPLPPLANTFGDGFAGGSLRQHLQQQRRVSRNVSPKPQRASTASPKIIPGQISSPLHPTFESAEGGYQYHFTASTLARAEKAKTQIELMSQYRRLLQYLPPLTPEGLEKSTTITSSIAGSPSSSLAASRPTSNVTSGRRLGRQYNPLQYIRNRKVRARERKGIDGEAQGFDNLEEVSKWVDQISKEVEKSQSLESILLPTFSSAAEAAASPHASPPPSIGKSPQAPVRVKRPRIDWELNPADLLADVFWLEQDNNKSVVEDRLGRKVFPQQTERRPLSRNEQIEPQKTPDQRRPLSPDLRLDTKLPEFKSMKGETERHYDSTTSKVRHKIRDATRINHGHNGSTREAQLMVRSRSRSPSDSSDTDYNHRSRRKRRGTSNSHDRERDILEKQMMEMLAKEARENPYSSQNRQGQRVLLSTEAEEKTLKEGLDNTNVKTGKNSRSSSIIAARDRRSKRNSIVNDSSGRASLEVPGSNPRRSLEGLDSTAPSSPLLFAARVGGAFVPSIAMDLSPPQRQLSPSRNPLQRVKSKIHSLDHSRSRGAARTDISESSIGAPTIDEPLGDTKEQADKRNRSLSPLKRLPSRRQDDQSKPSSKGSIRRAKTNEESSGIRGLFKGTRGPVARVGDLLWKKDSPVMSTSSGFSSDDSDLEEPRGTQNDKTSRDSSIGPSEEGAGDFSRNEKPSFLDDMPSFTPPFGRRGRIRNAEESIVQYSSLDRQARDERRKTSRANLLETTPRIDIQDASPSSSPELKRTVSRPYQSSESDGGLESRRQSMAYPSSVKTADQRLNYILGLPGHRRKDFPVTGLYNVETSRVGRPSLDGKRQWSISDAGVDPHRGPMTNREIARVRALLLSSGLKAREISRRAAEPKSFEEPPYTGITSLTSDTITKAPRAQQHLVAAKILSNDIQLSKQVWQQSADKFCNVTITSLISRISTLQEHLAANLTPAVRVAADDADAVSRELVTSHTLHIKRVTDKMDKMLRRRRRRLRWLRRAGWVGVEWALVGVMWFVWALVVLLRIGRGIVRGVSAVGRWLFWL